MSENHPNDYRYDVAISCLDSDRGAAEELERLISGRVNGVFLYSSKQEQLVGNDGLEYFRRVFRHEARVAVVMYREGWGKSDWTNLEETAIEEKCLRTRFSAIIVHSLDGKSPEWLPETHIHHSDERYGIKGLAAVVEHKVRECGGAVGEEDVVEMAQRAARRLEQSERRERQRRTEEAVQAAVAGLRKIHGRLEEVCQEATGAGLQLRCGQYSGGCYVQTSLVAMVFLFHGHAINSVMGAQLDLTKSDGPPGTLAHRDASSIVSTYDWELNEAEEWSWHERVGAMRWYSSDDLADLSVRLVIEEYERRQERSRQRSRRVY